MIPLDATVSAAQARRAAPPGSTVRFAGEVGRFGRPPAHGAVLLTCTLGGATATSLVVVAVWGPPRIATELTSVIAHSVERKLGAAAERQVRADLHHTGAAFECGNGPKEKPGRTAFDKLMRQIEPAADLPIPPSALVVRQPEENAITLPGGYIDVFEGLLDKAATPDGLADVIAHEVGHVAHVGGTKMVLQASGLSRLLDGFVRGGAVILTTKVVARIETAAGSAPTRALLDRTEWAALKNICAGA